MRTLSINDLLLNVPERWKNQYSSEFYKNNEGKQTILQKLLDLKMRDITKENINAIIGNQSWTKLECNECERDVDKVVIISEKYICYLCLRKATNLLEEIE